MVNVKYKVTLYILLAYGESSSLDVFELKYFRCYFHKWMIAQEVGVLTVFLFKFSPCSRGVENVCLEIEGLTQPTQSGSLQHVLMSILDTLRSLCASGHNFFLLLLRAGLPDYSDVAWPFTMSWYWVLFLKIWDVLNLTFIWARKKPRTRQHSRLQFVQNAKPHHLCRLYL